MQQKYVLPLQVSLLALMIHYLSSCDQTKGKIAFYNNSNRVELYSAVTSSDKNPGAYPCDSTIWHYVYNPTRLEVIQECLTVTGKIEESNADEDGDQHLLLRLDAGQDKLLLPKNIKKKNGCLVIEAVCINNIEKSKVGDACKGYINHVQLPEVGDHVIVTGSYVNDTHNGWAEIHPISKVEIIK